MTKAKKSTNKDKFYVAGKEEIKDQDAPVVGGEFQTEDGEWQGQTVTVSADTKFSDDLGTGDAVIIRTFEFLANPETFIQYEKFNQHAPTAREIFESHRQGIAALLWGDGLTPTDKFEPRLVFSKDKTRYLITVGAKPMQGMTLSVKTQTLTEIFNPKSNGRTKSATTSKDTV